MRFRSFLFILFFALTSLLLPPFLPASGESEGQTAAAEGSAAAGEAAAADGIDAGQVETNVNAPEPPPSPIRLPRESGFLGSPSPDHSVIAAVEDNARDIETRVSGDSGTMNYAQRVGIALGIIAGQALLIWLVWRLFLWFKKKLAIWGGRNIKPLSVKKLRVLSTKQIIDILQFFLRILKYIVTIFQLFITIPIVFSLFPLTENLASTLFGYILTPLKNILFGTLKYIPNLITIISVLVIARYVIRGLKFFATPIAQERLVIPGFYADWAWPTFNILKVLVYAFTMTVVYPYLPGSGSAAFQGVSIFVGLIFSLGSTSAIGNLIAGLVITYMRPFQIGDRIQVKEVTGFVVEKTLIVIRIRTHKNEYVTFPNMMILNSSIVNYNTSSAEDEEGLILHADVTMGYAVPWTQVHEILIGAALKTTHVLEAPKPFVLQTALDDFYAKYQINAYTKEVNRVPAIYSELYQNLQDGFKAAGIDLTAPTYQIRMLQESPAKLPKDTNMEKAVF
jgi:small-conductance mechanosensitive channel